MKKYGLIGKTLKHSFSKKFFSEKFEKEGIDAKYDLYEIPSIVEFPQLIRTACPNGLNVTIPYKEQVMDFLDEIDDTAKEIGAVNTIHFIKADGHSKLYGYNTDIIGFTDSLTPQLRPFHKKALILGTGGASKAVEYSLHKLDIETQFVSRTRKGNCITYDEIDKEVMNEYLLIVNCSPVGMFPNIESAPSIPYDFVTDKHYLYDLVYNPTNTKFCEFGKAKGAITKNGLDMLHGQAIASWKIWNK